MLRINWLRVGVVGATFAAAFAQSAGAQVVCTVTVTGQNDPVQLVSPTPVPFDAIDGEIPETKRVFHGCRRDDAQKE